MLLAVDVGNTQTVIGLYSGETLLHMWRVATNKAHTPDEVRIKLQPLMTSEGIKAEEVSGFALASVVPQLTPTWSETAYRMFGCEALVVGSSCAGGLFKTTYTYPPEIGADRVADAIAAVERYGAPVVVVDFGTATNIEVIDCEGNFIGGIIAPGVETSAAALFSHASRLSAIDLVDPGVAIGATTEQAVQVGTVLGEADRVDGLVRRIFTELGYETPVIATGGLAFRVAPASSTITDIDPDLTLEGLRLIFEATR